MSGSIKRFSNLNGLVMIFRLSYSINDFVIIKAMHMSELKIVR